MVWWFFGVSTQIEYSFIIFLKTWKKYRRKDILPTTCYVSPTLEEELSLSKKSCFVIQGTEWAIEETLHAIFFFFFVIVWQKFCCINDILKTSEVVIVRGGELCASLLAPASCPPGFWLQWLTWEKDWPTALETEVRKVQSGPVIPCHTCLCMPQQS